MVSIVGSNAEQVDLVVDQGFDVDLIVPVDDVAEDGTVTDADLVGWSARAVCRTRPGATDALFDVSPEISGNEVVLHIDGDTTGGWEWVSGVWELSISSGVRDVLLAEGTVTVRPSVSV